MLDESAFEECLRGASPGDFAFFNYWPPLALLFRSESDGNVRVGEIVRLYDFEVGITHIRFEPYVASLPRTRDVCEVTASDARVYRKAPTISIT